MKKLNFRALVIQITAILLFFALAFGATAASVGLLGGSAANGDGDSPFDQLFRPSTQKPSNEDGSNDSGNSGNPENPGVSDNPSVDAGYVQNLSNAFNTGLIEGYTDDRSSVSLSERIKLYNRLTASIGTADGTITPVTYKLYDSDTYTIVKRLQLEHDYISGTEIITKYTKEYSNQDATYQTVATPYLIGRKTVQSYMGYLLISRVELRQVAVTTPPATTTAPPATALPTTDPEAVPSTTPTVVPETNPVTAPTTVPATDPIVSPDASAAIGSNVIVPETSPVLPENNNAPDAAESHTPVTAGSSAEAALLTPEVAENAPSAPSVAPDDSAQTGSEETEIRYETVEVTVLSLYDRNGNLLIDDLGTKEPYYARDYSNRPVFIDEEGKLYSFDGTKFRNVDRGDLRSNLFYDYPAVPLGAYRGVYEAHYSEKLGGYHYINYKNGGTIYSSKYFKAFNYSSEGIALVVSAEDNKVMLINRSRTQVIKPSYQWYVFYQDPVTGRKQYARDFYAFPDTLGIESIGCAGFDQGWIRIRIQAIDMVTGNRNLVIRDDYFLMNTKGKLFDIPAGYTLEGYSDGVLLLSKDGLYGYYSLEGDWIAQPIYSYARPFVQGLAVLGSEDGTVGMIDTKGNIVLPFVYTSIEDISSGLIVTYCEGIGYETYELVEK